MEKIIYLSKFLKQNTKKSPRGYIQFDEIEKCMDMLHIQAELLDELSRYAEDFLRKLSFDPADFALSSASAHDYMVLNFAEFESGEQDIYLSFEAKSRDIEYVLEVSASCEDGEMIQYDGTLFRKSNSGSEVYDMGYHEWCECPD